MLPGITLPGLCSRLCRGSCAFCNLHRSAFGCRQCMLRATRLSCFEVPDFACFELPDFHALRYQTLHASSYQILHAFHLLNLIPTQHPHEGGLKQSCTDNVPWSLKRWWKVRADHCKKLCRKQVLEKTALNFSVCAVLKTESKRYSPGVARHNAARSLQ